jgi:hypothetical protein
MALLQKAYLGATPLFRDTAWFEDDAPAIGDDSGAVTVTANASAHTKGAYAEIIASTSANASFLVLVVGGVRIGATNTATLLDIATGASGSETDIAANIAVGGASGTVANAPGLMFGFPIKVASGTRLSARIQSVVTGGKTASVRAILIDGGDYATAPTTVDVIGGNTANSEGISFSGASGTWVEGIASTSQAYRAVALVCSLHDGAAASNANVSFEVGIGASGSEVAFGTAKFTLDASESSATVPPFTYLFGRSIPAGSRLAVKHPFAANPSKYGFCLIGIP